MLHLQIKQYNGLWCFPESICREKQHYACNNFIKLFLLTTCLLIIVRIHSEVFVHVMMIKEYQITLVLSNLVLWQNLFRQIVYICKDMIQFCLIVPGGIIISLGENVLIKTFFFCKISHGDEIVSRGENSLFYTIMVISHLMMWHMMMLISETY